MATFPSCTAAAAVRECRRYAQALVNISQGVIAFLNSRASCEWHSLRVFLAELRTSGVNGDLVPGGAASPWDCHDENLEEASNI